MKKITYRILLVASIIIPLSILNIACSDEDDYSNEGLVLVPTNRSFSLLSLDIDGAQQTESAAIASLIKDYNPQVAILDNVAFDYSQSIDLVTDIAYTNSSQGQRRQGYFSSAENNGATKNGTGFFVTNTFSGTNKTVLDNVLVLHSINYILGTDETVRIASCSFDKKSFETAKKQAMALVNYSKGINDNMLISITIDNNDHTKEIVDILKRSYNQTCDVGNLQYTNKKTQFIFTPKNQSWGVKYASIVKLNSEGLLLRIGLN